MTSPDSEWILAAYKVLSKTQMVMHVNEIEEQIRLWSPVNGPSMPLEVLLTKEAAMGRKFTKPECSESGFFSLLPPQPMLCIGANSESPDPSISQNNADVPLDIADAPDIKYRQQYRRLKKSCKQMICVNAALYDEISKLEKKIETTSRERRAILEKVMTDQNMPQPVIKNENGESTPKTKKKRRKDVAGSPPAKRIKRDTGNSSESGEEAAPLPVSKSLIKAKGDERKRKGSSSITIPPIALDDVGRPILPISLSAGLTVYSIGQINDRTGYSVTSSIYPVGYCCTRLYACLNDLTETCTYTCKVSEELAGPQFEISSDADQDVIFTDSTPEGCHIKLMQAFKDVSGLPLSVTRKSDFFGLKHHVVKNLLQCSAGASNCLEYQWCKFEVVKDKSSLTTAVVSDSDPTSSFKAFSKLLRKSAEAKLAVQDNHVSIPEEDERKSEESEGINSQIP